MDGSAVTDLLPAVEVPEITSAATKRSKPTEPTTSDGSDGGDGSAASSRWSLTHEQQVHNLKENWKRVAQWAERGINFDEGSEANAWFERVVEKLQGNPCLDSSEIEIPKSLLGRFLPGASLSSLDSAILMGDVKMVQMILGRRPNQMPDTESHQPNRSPFATPLHWAVLCGDSHIVDALLEKGIDVNAQSWWGQTPLELACEMGNVTMLQQLLTKDVDKKEPIHVAVQHGDINFIKKLPCPNVNVVDYRGRTPLHYLAISRYSSSHVIKILQYLAQNQALDVSAWDHRRLSAFYVAVLYRNTQFVIALLDSFQDQIRLNEACDKNRGPPIQIAFEGGEFYKDIETTLMECDPVKGYMERLYRDRQAYVDAANAILVGAALIASVTFASWLQPPLSYTSYFGEAYSSFVLAPFTSDLNYVDVEHNIALRAFWVFNALSFYFAIATVVCGARSVLPRSQLFIKKTVEKLHTNLLVTSILLACSALFVIIAFAIAGTIVLTPLVKYQWCMIVPTLVGGMVCIVSLGFLVKSMAVNHFKGHGDDWRLEFQNIAYLQELGYSRTSLK